MLGTQSGRYRRHVSVVLESFGERHEQKLEGERKAGPGSDSPLFGAGEREQAGRASVGVALVLADAEKERKGERERKRIKMDEVELG